MIEKFANLSELEDYIKQKGFKDPQTKAQKVFLKHKGTISKSELKLYFDAWELENIKLFDKQEEKVILKDETFNYSEDITFILNRWAKEVRQKVFGSTNIPFNSYEDAIKWIKEKESDYFDNYKSKYAEKEILFDTKYKELLGLINKGEALGVLTIPYLNLPYKNEIINGVESILGARFEHSKELSYIRYELDDMSSTIRIDKFELLKFLLAGVKPKLPRYEVLQLPGIRSSIVIKIHVADLNFNEIKCIYDTYRDIRKVKKQKKITDKQRKIIDIINEMGQPPEGKGTSDYYKQALFKWNNRYPEERYTSWQALYKAYENIKEKLNRV